MKRIIKNAKVLYNDTIVEKEILFDENQILDIADNIEVDSSIEIIDGQGLTVLPGLVDVHVHLRQPGFENKETIETGTMAAAAGGFTTIFAMPNVNPYPDNKETMKEYLELIEKESIVHTYPFGTITEKEAGKKLSDLKGMSELNVKWFSDDGVGMNDQQLMANALKFSKETGAIISCHTEDLKYRPSGASVHKSEYGDAHGWIGIEHQCESKPIRNDLITAKNVGGKYHICHISSHKSIEYLRQAKSDGVDASGEVTAHHLLLNNEDVKGTNWKMNPPLRCEEDRLALIEALEDGTIDFIANDHAPHTKADKEKPMDKAAFGIVALETSFPLLYTQFVEVEKRWSLAQLVNWMSYKPAVRFGLEKVGKIEVGYTSNLILVDFNKIKMIDSNMFYSMGKNTPFNGYQVNCEVVETIVSGKTVFKI